MAEPRGAGRGGGLLFLAVLLLVAYLAVEAVSGVLRLVLVVGIVAAVAMFGLTVLRRR